MKAYIVKSIGTADQLQLVDIEKPVAANNEVVIKTKAISINPVDAKTRDGRGVYNWIKDENPLILGWDISGEVTESKSPLFKVGDEVFGMVNFPGHGKVYAEYVVAKADELTLKPSNINHEEAAAATLAPLTVWQVMVDNAGIKAGQRVLIHGASGGVGHYATQIARHLGAYVIGVSSEKNKDFVLANGAHEHVEYNDLSKLNELTNIDFVLDAVGEKDITELSKPVVRGGKIISIVRGNISEEEQAHAKSKDIEAKFVLVKSSGNDMGTIAGLLQKKIIKSHIFQVFDFEQMADAHRQIETGRTVGKVVVKVQ
ncbi:MAG: NADP-dependent oxidoreductase [Mucilaginibacter sp.]|nr:NADP-dependent oxidoreductase [Mucilaginibacter sp.]